MTNANAANGQVKGLQNISRLGLILVTASLAATSVQAITASRSFTVGDAIFGGTASVNFNDAISGSLYRATVSARADGKVLAKTVPLGSGTSTLEIQPLTKCHAYGSLTMAGLTLASWDKSFSGSANFGTAPFVRTQAGGSRQFGLGPMSVTLRANAKSSIYAKGTVTVSTSPTTGLPIVRGSFGPAIDASASASGSVSVPFAGVNVSGSLALIGVGLTGDISYANQIGRRPAVAYRATADIQSTDGMIRVCAFVDPPFLPRHDWCTTIFQYHGGRNSYVIANGSYQL